MKKLIHHIGPSPTGFLYFHASFSMQEIRQIKYWISKQSSDFVYLETRAPRWSERGSVYDIYIGFKNEEYALAAQLKFKLRPTSLVPDGRYTFIGFWPGEEGGE